MTLHEIAAQLSSPLVVGDGVTAARVCRLCRTITYGGATADGHLGECPVLDIRAAIEAALLEVQATERARCLVKAQFEICDPKGCLHECCRTARAIAEAIEQETP